MNEVKEFISDLNECYGEEKLEGIKEYLDGLKHVELVHWRALCVDNIESISKRSAKYFKPYIDVPINFKLVFELADAEELDIIWDHLAVVARALLPEYADQIPDPNENKPPKKKPKQKVDIRKMLEVLTGGKGVEGTPYESLVKLVDELQDNISSDTSPAEAFQLLFQSNAYQEMIAGFEKGMQDGTFDPSSFMGFMGNMGGGNPTAMADLFVRAAPFVAQEASAAKQLTD
jgi:hypothetical protein